MDLILEIWALIDAFLRAPYLWPLPPLAAFGLGTFLLAIWCAVLGELTIAVLYRVNAGYIARLAAEMRRRHRQSLNALKAGDKGAWRGINRLANEAFGKAFFLQLAMGASSLWPAFLAAAWLQQHFGEVRFALWGWRFNFLPPYVALYILARIIFSRLKRRLPFFRQTLALAQGSPPENSDGPPAG